MEHSVEINILKNQRQNSHEKVEMNSKRYFCPDNFSTGSGPSVHSYLRNIYDDSLTSSSSSSSYTNNNNNNKETEAVKNKYTISLSTMAPEERKNLIDHLNEFSFETFQNNSNNNNNNNITSCYSSSYKIGPKEMYPVNTINDQWEDSSSKLSYSDLKGNKSQFNEFSSFLDAYSINTPLRRNTLLPSSISTKPNRRFSHKKTDAISLSQEFDMDFEKTGLSKLSTTEKNLNRKQSNKNKSARNQFERFNDIYIGDNDTYTNVTCLPPTTSPSSYTHHLSPIKTINNTREQIERNQNGNFKSLNDFANFNNIDLQGKNFVSRPCTPKINLEENIPP